MANFFLDNKDLQFHLQHPLMRKIVALKERNYTLKDHHELAPQNFEDAMDNYRRVLEIAGEVCGEVIAPNAGASITKVPESRTTMSFTPKVRPATSKPLPRPA